MTMLTRVMNRFDDATQLSRKRGATSVLFHGRAALSDRILNRIYFEIAAVRWQVASQDPAHLEPFLLGLDHCGDPSLLVDVGTGTGASAAAAAAKWTACRVVGVDSSRAMLRRARSIHSASNLEFRRSSVDALPFDDSSIDAVTMLHAVAYPPEIHRILKPGGRVLSASRLFGYQPLGGIDPWVGAGFDVEDHDSVAGGHWVVHIKP